MSINNHDNIIDSRDVIDRIEELENTDDAEEKQELSVLEALAAECSDYAPDWEYGETLIRRSHFVAYAEQLAIDCGSVEPTHNWPNYCIDWEEAADELEQDYTSVDFDGVEYLIRSC